MRCCYGVGSKFWVLNSVTALGKKTVLHSGCTDIQSPVAFSRRQTGKNAIAGVGQVFGDVIGSLCKVNSVNFF